MVAVFGIFSQISPTTFTDYSQNISWITIDLPYGTADILWWFELAKHDPGGLVWSDAFPYYKLVVQSGKFLQDKSGIWL